MLSIGFCAFVELKPYNLSTAQNLKSVWYASSTDISKEAAISAQDKHQLETDFIGID